MSVKKIIVSSLIAVTALGSALATATTATAGSGGCTLGYACLWEHRDYEGKSYGKQYDGPVVSTMTNKASSAAANGNQCHMARFYDAATGPTGAYFELYSETRMDRNYRDPNLRNGAGVGPYAKQNWNDRVSYIYFLGGSNCR